ncbi:MAG: MarR family transcriptional regulator [Proteobacteria bacterium]|nr:MarR family transcriptional regulator [Pseudomonadota bacterium]
MELKPQDLLVLLKVAAHLPRHWTYAALGEALSMSASETHASVKRAVAAGLAVAGARGEWSPVRPSLLEFALHGVRYVWPAVPGPVKRGVPTAFGAEPLASQLTAAAGEAPVWAHSTGSAKGPTVAPLYRTAPQAALADPALHRLLALVDALRVGRVRERQLAAQLLEAELKHLHAQDPEAADARQ